MDTALSSHSRWSTQIGIDCLKFVEKNQKKREESKREEKKRKGKGSKLLFLAFKLFSGERRSAARTVPLTLCRCAKYA